MSQPVYEVAYPNAVIRKLNIPHSNGNYVPVIIVVAVIVVLAVVSCAVSRLCNRQHHRVEKEHHDNKAVENHAEVQLTVEQADKSSTSLGPGEWESMQRQNFKLSERDYMELGFGMRIPSAGMANNGGGMALTPYYSGGRMALPPYYSGGGMVPLPPHCLRNSSCHLSRVSKALVTLPS